MKTANRKQIIDKVIERFIKSNQFNSIEWRVEKNGLNFVYNPTFLQDLGSKQNQLDIYNIEFRDLG